MKPFRSRHEPSTELTLESLLPSSLDSPIGETENLDRSGSTEVSGGEAFPASIDRYRVVALLGEGGYGRVFKAFDSQLQRNVAIKVPHLYRITTEQSLDRYLDEARTLAKLEHPAIVAVHDVGVTENGLPYIVSNFIDGSSLASRMRESPLSLSQGIDLLLVIARALAYIHSRGVVHRDVKPANILINGEGEPFLADFGLALRDELPQAERQRVGTPAYMSPEQARGEAHLVDGRSDIFSLGVVFYEMMTGKLPFSGDSRKTIIRNLLEKEVPPPRQLNGMVPRELERVCLKALAKRSTERYSTASDFADDLEFFRANFDNTASDVGPAASEVVPAAAVESSVHAAVVPRGLRSFERHDASFFCQLLPGPYDRDWVPESLLFWKRKLEQVDQDDSLRVGVIYGPSGCGKSSFVKAGLLPLLDDSLAKVFVEATSVDTEARLLRGIRKRCPGLTLKHDLTQSLAEIRRGSQLGRGRRLLLVIDQFEQWLHGRPEQQDSDLAMALRQCDGVHLQCLLLIRDDFWLAMSRFASILEIPLKQNQNVTMIDLFSLPHARRVLADFGVAYDRLSPVASERTAAQNQFLDQAIAELSEDGKIISVRLSLFVEMVKSQPWDLSTLSRLGGVQGIGTQFLEESFSSPHAPASQRIHETAVRNVLRRLLPEQGGNLKGTMRIEQELQQASGYQDQPAAFDELMQILDNELRLITPTDPLGSAISDESMSESGDGTKYYQLTHDFLVPALGEWLNKKQRETRRGRAELRLAEYANLWANRPVAKFAPSWAEWVSIRSLSSPQTWNETERRMMRSAGKRHLTHSLIAACLFVLVVSSVVLLSKRSSTLSKIRQLRTSQTSQLDGILDSLRDDNWFAPAALRQALAESEPGSREDLLCRLALLSHDPSQSDVLADRMLTEPIPMVLVLREELRPMAPELAPVMEEHLKNPRNSDSTRLRASIALAAFASPEPELIESSGDAPQYESSSVWVEHAEFIVDQMLDHTVVAPQDYTSLVDSLEPAKRELTPALATRALQAEKTPTRISATGILVRYVKDDPQRLLTYALDASADQYDSFLVVLDEHLSGMSAELIDRAFAKVDPELPEPEFDRMSRQKATAAALLNRIGLGSSTWPLLESSPMPHARSYLIHFAPLLNGDFDPVLNRLVREPSPSIRQGLVLMLGQFDWEQVSEAARDQAIGTLRRMFEDDPEVGVHSAARWALRRHGDTEWVYESLVAQSSLPRDPRKNWYVNGTGQTMAIFDARHVPEIGRVFEISTTEVTLEQFRRFRPGHVEFFPHRSPTPDCPSGSKNWYLAVNYCRWLTLELDVEPAHAYPAGLTRKSSPEQLDVDDVLEHGAYRLPTSHEWMYACAHLSEATRYFGLNHSLINEYVWHWDTCNDDNGNLRYWPGDVMKPNDSGMFAMYDGVREWCHDLGIRGGGERRSVMGNHSAQDAKNCTTAEMWSRDLPNASNGYYGLRVARTVTAD